VGRRAVAGHKSCQVTVDPNWIRRAAREAITGMGFDLLIICAFAFDPQAVKTTGEFKPNAEDFSSVQEERKFGRLPILLVRAGQLR
jgi:adenine-specific DNA-methyltransferase